MYVDRSRYSTRSNIGEHRVHSFGTSVRLCTLHMQDAYRGSHGRNAKNPNQNPTSNRFKLTSRKGHQRHAHVHPPPFIHSTSPYQCTAPYATPQPGPILRRVNRGTNFKL